MCTQILCYSGLDEPSLQQYQENFGYGHSKEELERRQVAETAPVQMGTAPNEVALNLSVPERLRRLAGRYVSNQDSTVNGVHLEPGPTGRFQVVITIDIGDILADTTK